MNRYEIMITKRHWVEVTAETEEEAFLIAEDQIPSFSSSFEDGEMEIVETEERRDGICN